MRRAPFGRALRMATAGILGISLAGACGGPNGSPPASPGQGASTDGGLASTKAPTAADAATRRRAPFVLAIVVDQLSSWAATSRWPELPPSGAFARLAREGTWVKNLRYPYAVTDTGPGHASLATGKVPAESGIFGNEVPDLRSGDRVSVMRDDAVRILTADGIRPGPGPSPAILRVDTVADRLRKAHPDALVVSVSLKDRAAILPAGRSPTHALWFEPKADQFVTSSAIVASYPKWALGIGDARAVAHAREAPWELADPAWVKAHAATPDDQAGEGDLQGLGTTFPHTARTGPAFRATPFSDRSIAALALAAMAAEYDPARPTLLLLSMSASDVIGHVFGPDSWEAWDHLRRLDATLGEVIETLDRRVGAPIDVLLSSDHGGVAMAEVPAAASGVRCPGDPYERPCTAGTRLIPTLANTQLRDAAKRAIGPGVWVAGVADPYLFLTPAARALPSARRALLDAAVRSVLEQHPAIASVHDVRALATQCPPLLARAAGVPDRARLGEDVLTLVCRSWPPGSDAGDYFLVPGPGSYVDSEIVTGKGSGHGTPYAFDRTVPMLVRGPGRIAAGAVITDPVDFSAFAALQAAFFGLDPRAAQDILEAHRARAR